MVSCSRARHRSGAITLSETRVTDAEGAPPETGVAKPLGDGSAIAPTSPRTISRDPRGRRSHARRAGFARPASIPTAGIQSEPLPRRAFDLAERFPLAVAAIAALPARSCIVDSEAIACDANGLSVFDLLRYRRQDDAVTLCAFDLLELDGVDLRPEPIEVRKRTLSRLLRRKHAGISFNRHFDVEGAVVYRHACALGCEGIVSKRLGSPYRPGRQDCWVKVKNPTAPAVLREAKEDWA